MKKYEQLFNELYGDTGDYGKELEAFTNELEGIKAGAFKKGKTGAVDWYKDAVVYSMYVDLYNKDMSGLLDKLDDLMDLGVTCLWLLPILESPMVDAGFDISDYSKVRQELLGSTTFEHVIEEAHKRGIRIIFDIAMNHCSIEHEWFKEARKSIDNPYRDYFIWSKTDKKYEDARIIFKGLCKSNWELDPTTNEYFYHRFFEIQPDLNYRTPKVLLSMTKTLIEWKIKGVDGFRADAVPFIWKEEGTICENLPKTHTVVKFMRAVLDYLEEGSLFLAEACQPPKDVVEYFGEEDECQAAYHFPVMPRIYKAMAVADKTSIINALDESFTPAIPKSCQWFMFLRCHDELTLEMVTDEERKTIYDYYVKNPLWDFREGEGISARISELLGFDLQRIKLAYSIMFTLLGTPIIYYGDEYGKGNDYDYYESYSKMTGYKDSRYLARGPIDWEKVNKGMKNHESLEYKVYNTLKQMLNIRKQYPQFSRGQLKFVDTITDGTVNKKILSYIRELNGESILILQNLSNTKVDTTVKMEEATSDPSIRTDLLTGTKVDLNKLKLKGYEVMWIKL